MDRRDAPITFDRPREDRHVIAPHADVPLLSSAETVRDDRVVLATVATRRGGHAAIRVGGRETGEVEHVRALQVRIGPSADREAALLERHPFDQLQCVARVAARGPRDSVGTVSISRTCCSVVVQA